MLLCIVGFRGVITLHNPLNHAAEFTWTPILGDRGTAFSIRPAEGMLHDYSNLRGRRRGGGRETAFSIRPAEGMSHIYSNLNGERRTAFSILPDCCMQIYTDKSNSILKHVSYKICGCISLLHL